MILLSLALLVGIGLYLLPVEDVEKDEVSAQSHDRHWKAEV